jgi:3-deoxy-D-manno-octulosonic acid kinase
VTPRPGCDLDSERAVLRRGLCAGVAREPGESRVKALAHFKHHSSERAVLYIEPEFEGPVLALKPLEHRALHTFVDEHAADRGPAGRGPTAIVHLPDEPTRVHVRPIRHGGWLGGVLGGHQFGVGRPLSELNVNHRLRAARAPVPHPVFLLGYRHHGLWETAFASVFVERSLNGEELLRQSPDRHRLESAARAAGRAVRALHDAGGQHADLNLRNLLFVERPAARSVATEAMTAVDASVEFEVSVIDLDRATLVDEVDPARRMRELMRLLRSLRKHDLLAAVGSSGVAAFFAAYVGGDRDLRGQLLATRGREEWRNALHALGYRS